MSAPRISQFLPLRQLATVSKQCSRQRRNLHMTGPATYASPVIAAERPVSNLPRDMTGLQAEAKRRKIDSAGSKNELTARLKADDLFSTRAFSTARPSPASSTPSATPGARSFNTSRALKANNDTSTIDFAYFPDFTETAAFSAAATAESDLLMRVPIIKSDFTSTSPSPLSASAALSGSGAVAGNTEGDYAPVMKPQISASSLDSIVLPIADASDNGAVAIDFAAFAAAAQQGASWAGETVRETLVEPVVESANAVAAAGKEGPPSTIGRLWEGLVEDVMGKRRAA